MMPYVDRLEPFAQWYAQLWAESLGKDGKGTTPVRALGTVDQHSQLQLYLAGAGDKFFTIVTTAHTGRGERFPLHAPDRDLAWLAGRTMGDLMDASQRATAETLIRNGRPTRVITIDPLDEHGLGELIMHFLIETILAGHLLGVDPFGQPAVEEGKRLARRYVAELEGV
jgi:glucose-6-phosphate isomerase